GQRLTDLVQVLGALEEKLQILERRGLTLGGMLARSGGGPLPVYHVHLGTEEKWLATADEVDAFRQARQEQLGHELVVGDDLRLGAKNGNGNGHAETLFVQELHEVRGINQALERLRAFGLTGADLVPLPRVAGREPPLRFVVENGDSRRALAQL